MVATLAVAALALVRGSPLAVADDWHSQPRGAFTCDFSILGDTPTELIAPGLELDRTFMSARPGFIQKHVPFSFDLTTGDLFSGGRYLFESVGDAENYKHWIENEFDDVGGVLFFDRPFFLHPECYAWTVIGAKDFGDVHTDQVVVRTERWRTQNRDFRRLLRLLWPLVRWDARGRGLTGVQLLYSEEEQLVSLVYFADRVVEPDPNVPDFASLLALADAPPLGEGLEHLGWTRIFDRTQWVLTIWFPFEPGDMGDPSVWPNSPPLPGP
jgi:hypothetical protein